MCLSVSFCKIHTVSAIYERFKRFVLSSSKLRTRPSHILCAFFPNGLRKIPFCGKAVQVHFNNGSMCISTSVLGLSESVMRHSALKRNTLSASGGVSIAVENVARAFKKTVEAIRTSV